MTTPGTHPDPWPLRHLVLCTPRLELRPDDDAGLDELVSVAYAGVHPPEEMPFGQPWTDTDPRYLGRGTLQHFWNQRSTLSPQDWNVHFLVRLDGRVCGVQNRVSAKLGYRPDGTATRVRRDAPAQEVRLLVTPAQLVRPEWPLGVAGLRGCLDLLGAR